MQQLLTPLFWFILAVALGIIEACTIQLVAIWPAIGALIALIPAALKAPFWAQVLVFLVITVTTLLLTRPLLVRYLEPKKQATNADRVIGQLGIVTEPIDNIMGTGRVYAMGLSWAARSLCGEQIAKDACVQVVRIEGVKLIVKPMKGV